MVTVRMVEMPEYKAVQALLQLVPRARDGRIEPFPCQGRKIRGKDLEFSQAPHETLWSGMPPAIWRERQVRGFLKEFAGRECSGWSVLSADIRLDQKTIHVQGP